MSVNPAQNTLRDENKRLKIQVEELLKDCDSFRLKNADLAEKKKELEAEVRHYKKRFEEQVQVSVETATVLRGVRASADYYGKELLEVTRKMFERGARRAEYDESYAVFRELIIAGQPLDHDHFVALVKANPLADLRGLVRVAEEFGLKVKLDLVEKDLIKQGGPLTKKYRIETKVASDGKKYNVEVELNPVVSMWAAIPKEEE